MVALLNRVNESRTFRPTVEGGPTAPQVIELSSTQDVTIAFDFSEIVDDGDSLSSVFLITEDGTSTGLVISGSALGPFPYLVQCKLSSLAAGSQSRLRCDVDTAQGDRVSVFGWVHVYTMTPAPVPTPPPVSGVTEAEVEALIAAAENTRARVSPDPPNTLPTGLWPEATIDDVLIIARAGSDITEYWTAISQGNFGVAPTLIIDHTDSPTEATYLLNRADSVRNVAPDLAEVQVAYPAVTALIDGDNIRVELLDNTDEWWEVVSSVVTRKVYDYRDELYNDAANSGEVSIGVLNRLTTDAGSYTKNPSGVGTREQIGVFCPTGQTATFNSDLVGETPAFYVEEGGSFVKIGNRERTALTTQGILGTQGLYDGEVIDVSGYYAIGDGIELRYRWDATSTAIEDGVTPATHPGLVCKPTAVGGAGRWIAIVPAGQINARWLGAKGDGIQDDTTYIQRAIDIAFYGATLFTHDFDADTIVLPFGKYLTSDTIHLTYGDGFKSASLISTRQGSAIDNYGTALLPNFTNRPAIAIQGARHCEVVGINIEGVDNTANGFDPSEQDESVWDTQYPTAAAATHNIFCAIAVDPYSGTDPGAGSYPDPTYPAGLGLSAWSKSHSNKVRIRDCRIRFFGAAVAVKPSGGTGADANGDFVKIQDCVIDGCKYGLAVGGSQTRMNTIENCQVVDCWAGAAGSVIGPAKSGDIRLVNSNFDRCGYWLYDPTVSQAGYHEITSCRGENSGCIAKVINGAVSIHTLVVENSVFVPIDTRADSDQEHYHLLAQDCDLVFTGNNVRISHATDVGRRIFIAAVGDGKVTAHGNTLQYLNTASGDQQTFAEEIAWAFPGSFVAWADVHSAGTNPPALDFQKVSTTGQQRLIVSSLTYDGGGQYSGRLHADLRHGQIRTGDYLSITPNDSTYTYYFFKVTSSDDLDITIEQINDTDNTGLPHNQAAVQAALESGGAWFAVSRGRQSNKHNAGIQRVFALTAAGGSDIDYNIGSTGIIDIDEAAKLLDNIANLPVGKTFRLACTKSVAGGSITLNTAANFTAASTFTADIAAIGTAVPFFVTFTRVAQGSGSGEIYAVIT